MRISSNCAVKPEVGRAEIAKDAGWVTVKYKGCTQGEGLSNICNCGISLKRLHVDVSTKVEVVRSGGSTKGLNQRDGGISTSATLFWQEVCACMMHSAWSCLRARAHMKHSTWRCLMARAHVEQVRGGVSEHVHIMHTALRCLRPRAHMEHITWMCLWTCHMCVHLA